MNINMRGFRQFSIFFCVFVLCTKVALVLDGLSNIIDRLLFLIEGTAMA